MKRNKKIVTGTAAAVIGISGIAAAGQVFAQNGSGEAGLAQAEEAALAEVAGEVIASDFEEEDGTTEYEFEIRAEDGTVTEVEVRDGAVSTEAEDDEADDEGEEADEAEEDEQVSFDGATVTQDEAEGLALEAVPGTVTETEADGEDGAPVYEFEIAKEDGTSVSVEVNAETGELKTEQEND